MYKIIWKYRNKPLDLGENDIHIWRVISPIKDKEYYWTYLSPDEKNRANKFYFTKDHDRYVCSRGILRCLLALYTEVTPSIIEFSYSSYGKPMLSHKFITKCSSLFFNVSHSHQCILYAFAKKNKIGIDVEYKKSIDFQEIAKQFFSNSEYNQIINATSELKEKLFYTLWTCKEAFVKALGEGLFFPLNEFDVRIDPPIAKIIKIKNDTAPAKDWALQAFIPAENYIAAFAVNDAIANVHYWLWENKIGGVGKYE